LVCSLWLIHLKTAVGLSYLVRRHALLFSVFFSTLGVPWGQLLHAQDAGNAVFTSCLVDTPTPAVATLSNPIIHSSSRQLCTRSTVHHQGHLLVLLATVGLIARHSAAARPQNFDAVRLLATLDQAGYTPRPIHKSNCDCSLLPLPLFPLAGFEPTTR
jgi:hypothetical protein